MGNLRKLAQKQNELVGSKCVCIVTVTDPDTKAPVEVEIRKIKDGLMIGLDGDFLQHLGDDEVVDSPYADDVVNEYIDIPSDEMTKPKQFDLTKKTVPNDTPVVFVLKDGSIEESHVCQDGDHAEQVFLERFEALSGPEEWAKYTDEDKEAFLDHASVPVLFTGAVPGRVEIHWLNETGETLVTPQCEVCQHTESEVGPLSSNSQHDQVCDDCIEQPPK